ncbi:hypothetical protein KDL44_09180 [bacterium]|nr:hypothetical protein [bacterium]
MNLFRITRRDLLVLFGIAWAVGLLYCFYLLGAKAMDMRRKAIIDANLTRNDIVIDNALVISKALHIYAEAHGGIFPRQFQPLVDQGYLSHIPLNPYTGAPMRIVRLGESPRLGEITLEFGQQYIYSHELGTTETRDAELLIVYGDHAEGFTKFEECAQPLKANDCWSAEVAEDMILVVGKLAISGLKLSSPYSWSRDSDEQYLTANGYTLPIQMEHDVTPGDDH